MGAKAVESVQRVVIIGQAWGKSSKVVKRSKKSQKYQKLLKRGYFKEQDTTYMGLDCRIARAKWQKSDKNKAKMGKKRPI
jgi:hypothetical protein